MADISTFWNLPVAKQRTAQKEIEQEAKVQEPGHLPIRSTLTNALEVGTELAVCASSLFITVVQDCCELGGGYRVQIIALDRLISNHLDELEQVETYLAETIPYKKDTPVWMPIHSFHSHVLETDFIKKLWGKND